MRIAFYTNLTAVDSLAVLAELHRSPMTIPVHIYFYNTLSEAGRTPIKILRDFGVRRLLEKTVSALTGSIRRRLIKGPLCKLLKPRNAAEFAAFHRLPHSIVSDLNSPESRLHLTQHSPDLLLVCVCKNILKQRTIEIPRLGALNIHPSLLPDYRGPMPIFWMLYHQETRAGVTFQRMTSKIDHGPIVAQYAVPLNPGRSEAEVSRELFALAASKLEEVLSKIHAGKYNDLTAESDSAGSYHTFPTARDRSELVQIQQEYRRAAVEARP